MYVTNFNDVGIGLYEFFAKSFVCHFYITISIVWSSLDYSKDNSKSGFVPNFVIR